MVQTSRNRIVGVVVAVVAVLLIGGIAYALTRDNNTTDDTTNRTNTTQQESSNQEQQNNIDDSTQPAPSDEISRAEAERIALDEFGGTIDDIDDDSHNNRPTWEIEIKGSREGDIEVEVDRQTGEILHWERD